MRRAEAEQGGGDEERAESGRNAEHDTDTALNIAHAVTATATATRKDCGRGRRRVADALNLKGEGKLADDAQIDETGGDDQREYAEIVEQPLQELKGGDYARGGGAGDEQHAK